MQIQKKGVAEVYDTFYEFIWAYLVKTFNFTTVLPNGGHSKLRDSIIRLFGFFVNVLFDFSCELVFTLQFPSCFLKFLGKTFNPTTVLPNSGHIKLWTFTLRLSVSFSVSFLFLHVIRI